MLKTYSINSGGLPSYLFEPYYQLLPNYKDLHNTDPFVFGSTFYYSICQQGTKPGQGLTELPPGSVILFGSSVNGAFCLDTVFVIKDSIPYKLDKVRSLKDKVPQVFYKVGLEPVCTQAKPETVFKLYLGATYSSPYEGMYSFAPCKTYDEYNSVGFKRPAIRLEGFTSEAKSQGVTMNKDKALDTNGMRKLWNMVREQVSDQGLKEGVEFCMPKRKV
ncbi:hypothetical protein RCC89_02990 [Cytophagaceae bacterium ABcell3]|nr:hypothetical protein RCC89_02990 [Cytophagaceae bacterium ABcell3]